MAPSSPPSRSATPSARPSPPHGLPCNRTRLRDEDQLAVKFADFPDPDKYADDFFFGYLVAASGADRKKIVEAVKKSGRDEKGFRFKRDSVLRMNLARGVEPLPEQRRSSPSLR